MPQIWSELNPRWGELFLPDANSRALEFTLRVSLTAYTHLPGAVHSYYSYQTPFPPFPGQKDVRAVVAARQRQAGGQRGPGGRAWASMPSVGKLVGMYRQSSNIAYDQLRSLFGLEQQRKGGLRLPAWRQRKAVTLSEPATSISLEPKGS